MADYQIDVGVNVQDSELDSLESRINSLKRTPITIDVRTNILDGKGIKSLRKDVEKVVSGVQKTAKKSPRIIDTMIGSPKMLDSIGQSLKKISDYKNGLNLGEIKLGVSGSVWSDLNQLEAKLKEIKTIATSMGSIKLKVSDNMNLADGELEVGSTGKKEPKPPTFKQLTTQLKDNAKAEGLVRRQLRQNRITQSDYNTSLQKILDERKDIQGKIKDIGFSNELIAANDLEKTIQKMDNETEKILNSQNHHERAVKTLRDNYNKLQDAYDHPSKDSKPLNSDYKKFLDELDTKVQEAEGIRKNLQTATGDDVDALNARLSNTIDSGNKLYKELRNTDQFIDRPDQRYSKRKNVGNKFTGDSEDLQEHMRAMTKEFARGSKYSTKYNADLQRMTATIDRGNGVTEDYILKYSNVTGYINGNLSKVTQSVKPFSSYLTELGTKFKTLSQYLISNYGFEVLTAGVRSGVNAIVDLDSAMTELKKTSNGTKEEYRSFTEDANVTAKEIGSTTVQITNSAADWSRLGYTLEDSATMAKTTGILKNVSEFESIEDATQSMVGIMQAYDVKANESMKVVDKLNYVGNNYSISTSDLASGLQIAGPALQVGGNTMEQSMALITAMNASVQDVNQAARAARTVSMRMHGVDAETLAAEGEDIEGLVSTVPKLEQKIKSLTAVNGKAGVSLTDATGRIREDYEVLLEIAERWDEIGEADVADGLNRQSALLEALAGKNRASQLASLFTNEDILRNVYQDAMYNSTNSAQNELNTYLDSIDARMTKVKESWSQLWQSEGTTNAAKGILDIGDGLINLVSTIGPGKSLAGVLGAFVGQTAGWGGTNYQLVL